MLKTAVLLVGGKAMRLRPITDDIPKCMVDIEGRPLIEWIIEWLKENGIEKVVLGVAYKKEIIMNHLGDGSKFGMKILYNDHSKAQDTGDAFRLAIENCNVDDENFLAMNGDELTDISLKNLYRFHVEHSPVATIVTAPLRSPFGIVESDDNHTITNFKEKPILSDKFVNAGVYIFNKKIKEYLPERGRLEETTFVKLANESMLKTFKYFGFWRTLNTHKDHEEMRKAVSNLKI
ncbi:nucleotidyltransferase family protein [Candidatus Woesearchaeota archaeon]|nr:nucleotidyltransferase family protein [Candidatus Woesearchaeota archaeon]